MKIFLKENNIEDVIDGYICDMETDAGTFVSYLCEAEHDYSAYKLKVNPEKLDKYFAQQVPDKLSKSHVLEYLIKDKTYSFEKTIEKIESTIKQDKQLKQLDIENFKIVFDTYKILSKEKPLTVQLDGNQRNKIWNALSTNPSSEIFLEILSIQLADGVSYYAGTLNSEQIEKIANNMDYYANYGDLLINSLSWNNNILNQVLKCMTEKQLGNNMEIEKVLSKFLEIKAKINIAEDVFLKQLNRWSTYIAPINKDTIQTIIRDASFFHSSVATQNELTNHLNTKIIEALADVPVDTLYKNKKDLNYYWFVVINSLVGTNFLVKLPSNLIDFGKRLLRDIASENCSIPGSNDLYSKIIDKLEKRDTTSCIKDIRNDFCNGKYEITTAIFKYFIHKFETQGDLPSRSSDVVRKIIEPVINDPDCLKILISKPKYYAEIIIGAGDDATGTIKKIEEILKVEKNTELMEFGEKIGVNMLDHENKLKVKK